MTRDDVYQVIYECSVCGKQASVDDTNLARIEKTFEALGWGNVPTTAANGKVDYTAYCPKCWAIEQIAAEDHEALVGDLDSQDLERQGLY